MPTLRALLATATLTTLTVLATTAPAQAQDYPTQPVRILTPFPAGAGPEVVLRMAAEKLQKKWGEPVIVENKPCANGLIAIDTWKLAGGEGLELLQVDNVHVTAYPSLFKKLP